MKSFIKNACIIFSIIFSILILIQFFRGEELSQKIVASFLFMALFSSGMSFLLVDNDKFSNRRVVVQQVVYLSAIMIAVIAVSYLSGFEQSFRTIIINFGLVVVIYIFIKYLLLVEDRKDAEEINKALERKRKANK